ncbi:MAG: hypothetical protein K0R73_806 [Candidatus Midichloriaceae bacterium]|jgi:ankyrin repeat protein|nr:hypothetical protein [Candidatus Midichloriaceae bacterium]
MSTLPSLVKVMLQYSFDVNAQNINGNTPLHLAYKINVKEMCDMLINHGARNDIKNNKGELPSEITSHRIS